MSINYIGEHLLPGRLGEGLVWLSFLAATLATVFYVRSFLAEGGGGWTGRKLARSFYLLHTLALTGVAVILYYLIFGHYFEYKYVWNYSSVTLPTKYIISCFWAGQEGSFLVWALFQAIVGLVLLRLSKDWEAGVMAVFSFSQLFVSSMLLGVHLGSWEIGSSPFILLRETVTDIRDTIFTSPDYLSMIRDGNGLNPLLENFWMTIHPPVLFLGYALALVPFSYAIAALASKAYISWIRVVLPWTLLALILLGAGILLGGAWAYVSLTFGGFWAWDPVENSSLVPWITLAATLHCLLIARRQNFALFSAFLFAILSYILVLYASYLTRSGVLSDTSAHSFGDNGMSVQLVLFLLSFLTLGLVMLFRRSGKFRKQGEEILLSREFWMFMGSLIMVLAAFQILFTTSIPVGNAILGTKLAPPSDAVAFYNRWQTPFAILVAGFIALTQALRFGRNTPRAFFRMLVIPGLLAAGLTVPFVTSGIVTRPVFILFLVAIWFAITASLFSLLFPPGKNRNVPAILSHLGFVIFLMGALITFSNSRIISSNTSGLDLGTQRSNRENLLLIRSDTLYMSGYYVTYSDKQTEGNTTTYRVDFLKRRSGVYARDFSLHPSVNIHPQMGAVYNPDTRHFLFRDIYTYIAATGKEPDYIVIKTILNPYINVLWLGTFVMLAGFSWAFIRRRKRCTAPDPEV